MMGVFAKMFGRGKSTNDSVLIKDYDANNKQEGDSSDVIPLRGSRDASGQQVSRKKDNAERFTESVDKLAERLEGINDSLSRQSRQSEQLVQALEELPKVLSSVPNAVNQQQEALRQMIEQLRLKNEQDQSLSQTLSRLPEQAGRQTESLEAIEDRLSASAEADAKLSETFGRVSESLGKLDADMADEVQWRQQISGALSENQQSLKETLTAQQRRFFRVFAVVVAVSLVAIAGLVVGLLLVLYQ